LHLDRIVDEAGNAQPVADERDLDLVRADRPASLAGRLERRQRHAEEVQQVDREERLQCVVRAADLEADAGAVVLGAGARQPEPLDRGVLRAGASDTEHQARGEQQGTALVIARSHDRPPPGPW
jgi:hypothetical protein